MYRLAGSATMLGVTSAAFSLPMLFLSPLGGALADRIKKKHAVLIGGIEGILVNLLVAIPLSNGYLSAENPLS